MPRKHKKKVAALTTDLEQKCVISTEPSPPPVPPPVPAPEPEPEPAPAPEPARESDPEPEDSPPENIIDSAKYPTILSDNIDLNLLSQWPRLKMKVPPVFLHNPVELEYHVKKILNRGIKFYQPHRGNNFIRIYCASFNDYKHFIKYLNKVEMPYHTYGLPSNRKMKVVIKNLPDTVDVDLIKEALKSVSIPVVRTHKMKTGPGTIPGTMLVLAVVPYTDVGKNILRLQVLLGHKVVLQPPEDKAKQCYRCQKWGHAQRYCHGRITCVKCAGDHLSSKCEKPYEEEPFCANCSQSHTASYRRCIFTRRPLDYYLMKKSKLLTPCYKPRVIVTEKNYEQLYKNVEYSKGNTAKPGAPGQTGTAQPSTVQASSVQPSTVQPSTVQPSVVQPSTAQSSTGKPSTGQGNTSQPSTSQPSTGQPSTGQPSTGQPSTDKSSTSQPTTSKSRSSKSKKGKSNNNNCR